MRLKGCRGLNNTEVEVPKMCTSIEVASNTITNSILKAQETKDIHTKTKTSTKKDMKMS